jgi:hypothetical protein
VVEIDIRADDIAEFPEDILQVSPGGRICQLAPEVLVLKEDSTTLRPCRDSFGGNGDIRFQRTLDNRPSRLHEPKFDGP